MAFIIDDRTYVNKTITNMPQSTNNSESELVCYTE